MSTEQYLADRMFGKRPQPRLGFKAHFEYWFGELMKLVLVAFGLAVVWAFGEGFREAGRQQGHHDALREVSRLAEDHALLIDYLNKNGH